MFEIELIICIKIDLALNNLQRLICHKNQPTNQPSCTCAWFTLQIAAKTKDLWISCPVNWGCRIHRLHLCRGVKPYPPMRVLDMTLNNLMVGFQECLISEDCRVPLHCHRFLVHSARSGSIWQGPIYGSNRTKVCTNTKVNCLK